MFKGDRNFTVGLFVSVAIAAFVLFVLWLTGRSGAEDMARYTLMFHRDVSGLAVGGPVKYMGMNIGSVIHMDLDTSQGVRVQVDIEILATTPVDSGTYASLALQGITGVAVVNLASEPGSHPPLPEPPRGRYPEILVRDVGFAALISSAPEIMSKLDHLLTRAGEMMSDDNLEAVASALRNADALSAALAGSGDTLAALPQDLSDTMAEIQSTADRLRSVIGQLQPDLGTAVANVNRSSENLAALTARLDDLLERHESDMSRFLEDGLGGVPALLRETRRSLRELEKLMAQLRDDPSQLIHRPATDALEIDP
jgi:phospholipid/cholesterol/gamma-HCH transport system substrate-binding protein